MILIREVKKKLKIVSNTRSNYAFTLMNECISQITLRIIHETDTYPGDAVIGSKFRTHCGTLPNIHPHYSFPPNPRAFPLLVWKSRLRPRSKLRLVHYDAPPAYRCDANSQPLNRSRTGPVQFNFGTRKSTTRKAKPDREEGRVKNSVYGVQETALSALAINFFSENQKPQCSTRSTVA